MKKLFTAIRKSDLETVKSLIESKPELVNDVAKQPPKKDDGLSALQVALKTGNFEIANFLLDSGANVNYIDRSDINDWNTPVLHDAIIAAVCCCRHNSLVDLGDRVLRSEFSSKEKADASFAVLKRILALGADVKLTESRGTTCVGRLCVTAADSLPSYSWGDHRASKTAEVTAEWKSDLGRIFLLLKEYGADFETERAHYATETEHPLNEFFALV